MFRNNMQHTIIRIDTITGASAVACSTGVRTRRKKIFCLLLVFVLWTAFCGLSGCQSESRTGADKNHRQQPGEAELRDDLGRTMKRPDTITRLVSLAPNVTDMLKFAGQGKYLVGISDFCDPPRGATNIARTGSLLNPNLEKIASLNPDMVFLAFEGNIPSTAEALKHLEIPGYTIRINSLDSLFTSLKRLNRLFAGTTLQKRLSKLKSTVQKLSNTIPGKRLFFHYGQPGQIYTFGKGSLLSELCRLSGAVNPGDRGQGRFPSMNQEMLAAIKPDLAIYLESDKQSREAIRQMWQQISPDTELRFLPGDKFLRPGPQLVYHFSTLVEELCQKQ